MRPYLTSQVAIRFVCWIKNPTGKVELRKNDVQHFFKCWRLEVQADHYPVFQPLTRQGPLQKPVEANHEYCTCRRIGEVTKHIKASIIEVICIIKQQQLQILLTNGLR